MRPSLFFSFFVLLFPFGSSLVFSSFVSFVSAVALKISQIERVFFFLFSPPPRNRPRSRARFSDPRARVTVLAFRGLRVPSPNASFPERVRREAHASSRSARVVAPLLVKGFPSFFHTSFKEDTSLDEEETDFEACPKRVLSQAGFGVRVKVSR